jgi:hypothetical protein
MLSRLGNRNVLSLSISVQPSNATAARRNGVSVPLQPPGRPLLSPTTSLGLPLAPTLPGGVQDEPTNSSTHIKESTFATYETAYRVHLLPFLGETDIREITREQWMGI